MKSTTASLIITALASTVIAQPHGRQQPARAAHQHKRALVTKWDVKWVTEYVTEYIDATATQFMYPSQVTSSPATTLATVITASTNAGQFVEQSSASSSSTTVVIGPVENLSSSSTYVAPTTTSTTPAAATTTSAASSSGSTVDANTGISAVLGSNYYTGDLTYYTLGLGSCGNNDSGEDMTANIVAMSAVTMGSESNDNPMCGKTIKIYNSANGKTATGTIQDKCPGCSAGSIDVSQKLFEELADLADGRVKVSWNWA